MHNTIRKTMLVSLIGATLIAVSGCASTDDVKKAQSTADQALSTAQQAQQAAAAAQAAAKASQATADKNSSAINELNQKVDDMQKSKHGGERG